VKSRKEFIEMKLLQIREEETVLVEAYFATTGDKRLRAYDE